MLVPAGLLGVITKILYPVAPAIASQTNFIEVSVKLPILKIGVSNGSIV